MSPVPGSKTVPLKLSSVPSFAPLGRTTEAVGATLETATVVVVVPVAAPSSVTSRPTVKVPSSANVQVPPRAVPLVVS